MLQGRNVYTDEADDEEDSDGPNAADVEMILLDLLQIEGFSLAF